MPLRKSVRFEVLKRDRFTCQYCGRRPPDVGLEVDHVVPRAGGGADDIVNLITACFDCNRGKAARELDELLPVLNVSDEVARIRARDEAVIEYDALKRAERQRWDIFREHWCEMWGVEDAEVSETVVSRYIDELGLEEVIQAADIARARFAWLSSRPIQYFVGILRNKAEARR